MSAKLKRRSSSSNSSSGLDVMADRISDIMHRSNKKVAASLDSADKAKVINSAVRNTTRQVNSAFKTGLGRQSKDRKVSDNTNEPSSKRKRTSTTDAANTTQVNMSQNILSYTTDDVVTVHATRLHSTQSLHYKRLLPNQIVNLKPNEAIKNRHL